MLSSASTLVLLSATAIIFASDISRFSYEL